MRTRRDGPYHGDGVEQRDRARRESGEDRGAEADVLVTQGKEFRIKARDSQRFCALVRMKGAEGWVEFTVTSKARGTVVNRIGMQRRPKANGLSPRAGMMGRADLWPSNPGGRE
jgi:hypothetical protein